MLFEIYKTKLYVIYLCNESTQSCPGIRNTTFRMIMTPEKMRTHNETREGTREALPMSEMFHISAFKT
jgi:hypothetical protein